MLRPVLTVLLPLLLPTLVFVAYSLWEARRLRAAGHAPDPWHARAPWLWLLAGGLVLALAALGTLATRGAGVPHGVYVPAHVGPDGRTVPARTYGPGEVPPADAPPAEVPPSAASGR